MLRAFYEGGKKQDIQIVAINDLGQIVANSATNSYLLTPATASVPESSALLTALLGISPIAGLYLRRKHASL